MRNEHLASTPGQSVLTPRVWSPHQRSATADINKCKAVRRIKIGYVVTINSGVPVLVLTDSASENADARTVWRIVFRTVANDQRAYRADLRERIPHTSNTAPPPVVWE